MCSVIASYMSSTFIKIFNQPFPTLLESIRIAPPKKATTSVFGGMGWVEVGHEC